MLGRSAERPINFVLPAVSSPTSRTTGIPGPIYIMIALMAAVEQGQLGEEFDAFVADMERIRLTPRRVWPSVRILWVNLAQGRLAQCLAASEEERPARLAAARAAIHELRRAASTPFLRIALPDRCRPPTSS